MRLQLRIREGFSTNAERVANRAAVDGTCAAFFAERSREANIGLLATAQIAYGRLSDLDDLAAYPQNRFIKVVTEHGAVELLAPASVVAGKTPSFGPVPSKDEQGPALREEFDPASVDQGA